MKVAAVKVRTVTDHASKTTVSSYYYLPKREELIPVCMTMFLNTLNISEKTLMTAVQKKHCTGIVEKDNRGGRLQNLQVQDKERRNLILDHIKRFPRMESHYCQSGRIQSEIIYTLSLTRRKCSRCLKQNMHQDKSQLATQRIVTF